MTDVDIKIENIVASASIGKDIVLTEVAKALEGVDFNREQFPGLVFKLQDPKTAALIFSSGKLVCTGAKSIDDSKFPALICSWMRSAICDGVRPRWRKGNRLPLEETTLSNISEFVSMIITSEKEDFCYLRKTNKNIVHNLPPQANLNYFAFGSTSRLC